MEFVQTDCRLYQHIYCIACLGLLCYCFTNVCPSFFFLVLYYPLFQARLLSYQLTKKPLPGLTSIEQLELLALADTFASAKLDLEESPGSIERGVKFAKKEGKLLCFRCQIDRHEKVSSYFIRCTKLPSYRRKP